MNCQLRLVRVLPAILLLSLSLSPIYGSEISRRHDSSSCTLIPQENPCSEKSSPEWDLLSVDQRTEREEVIRQAGLSALKRLWNCRNDLYFYSHLFLDLYHPQLEHNRELIADRRRADLSRGIYSNSKNPTLQLASDGSQYWPFKINLKVEYAGVGGGIDVAASNEVDYEGVEYYYRAVGRNGETIEYVKWLQEFDVNVLIYPHIFNSGELCIIDEGEWARTPTEAAMFIILHELGHFEAFFLKNFVPNPALGLRELGERNNTEQDAWTFASQIASCLD